MDYKVPKYFVAVNGKVSMRLIGLDTHNINNNNVFKDLF